MPTRSSTLGVSDSAREARHRFSRRLLLAGSAAAALVAIGAARGLHEASDRTSDADTSPGASAPTIAASEPDSPAAAMSSAATPPAPVTAAAPAGVSVSTEPVRGPSRASVSDDGTTMVNGLPFFPLGFYNVSALRSTEKIIEDIHVIGDAGFNVMHVSVGEDPSSKDWHRIYDEAARRGVYLMPEDTDRTFVETFRRKPAALGWSIWDDVNPAETNYAALLAKHRAYHQWDPDHITYYAVGGDNAAKTFTTFNTARRGDAFGLESYPVNNAPIMEVGPYMQKAVAGAARFGQSPYGVLQSFNLSQTRLQRAPSFAEFYNMTYQGIVAGLKGIIYYTFYDTGNYLPGYTELWQGAQGIPAEIEQIKPFLLNGKRTTRDFGAGVSAGFWQLGAQVLAILVNALETRGAGRSVSVPFSQPLAGPMRALFPSRPSGCVLDSGRLVGTLRSYEVHTYVIDAASPINGPLLG